MTSTTEFDAKETNGRTCFESRCGVAREVAGCATSGVNLGMLTAIRLSDVGLGRNAASTTPTRIGTVVQNGNRKLDCRWLSVLPPWLESEGDMIQMMLFDDDDRRRSSAEYLRQIRARFLRELAAGRIVDAGVGQSTDPYPPEVSQAVGPMIASLHRDGLIAIAGADYASRPTRHKTVARTWRANNIGRCKQLAEADLAWLTARQKDTGESAATDSPAVDSTTHPTSTKKENDGKAQ
jgi:hypothetical protein